ncbi:MAG TPA: S9 family peptidase, partial [Candidatus Dormibacteraeota bacterium]|nr:S9 family peptidase [Candidatus Dormibacteraeota bacterium]
MLLAFRISGMADATYRLPSPEIVRIIDAPPPPRASLSPQRESMLLVDYEAQPPIELLARPLHRLAGLRIDAALGARQRTSRNTGLTLVRLADGTATPIQLPEGARIGFPSWSPDGQRCAFTRDVASGVELWVAELTRGEAQAIPGLRLNEVGGSPFTWLKDSRRLLVRLVPEGRGPEPPAPPVPTGPIVEETSGRVSKPPTYQDLLHNQHDESLFAHFAAAQLALIDLRDHQLTRLGPSGLYIEAELSPDQQYLVTTRIKRPFSYRVPYPLFARTIEIRDRQGTVLRVVADLPVADDIPTQGVPTGPRSVDWQPGYPARLLWIEALDGGDPLKKVPHRDAILGWAAPFAGMAAEVMRVAHRFSGFTWLAARDRTLLHEYDRDRRWRTTALVDLSHPQDSRKVLFDLSANDAYGDPGAPLMDQDA